MKVIHNKFTPKILSKHVKNQYKKAQATLYPVSEVESYGDINSDYEEDINNMEPLSHIHHTKAQNDYSDNNVSVKDD